MQWLLLSATCTMETTSMTTAALQIDAVPAFRDNYIWLLYRPGTAQAWAIDPGDAAPLLAALRQQHLQLAGVLITHHHSDHDGGVPVLLEHFPRLRVVGGINGQSPYLNERCTDNATLDLLGLEFKVLEVPGHTLDHIAFYSEQADALFCGDTLFAGGCGRLFEGSADQLYKSLLCISQLPGRTRVFCAHEYTLSNLKFARVVEPANHDLAERQRDAENQRQEGKPTVPSTLALELATNPFLRCHEPRIMAAVREQSGDVAPNGPAIFAALRKWKDHF